MRGRMQSGGHRRARAYRNAHTPTHHVLRGIVSLRRIVSCDGQVDQNTVPNILLVTEPSLSTQRIGGRCGR